MTSVVLLARNGQVLLDPFDTLLLVAVPLLGQVTLGVVGELPDSPLFPRRGKP